MLSIRDPYPNEIVVAGPQDVLAREIARVGATRSELVAAQAFNASGAGFDPRAYDELSPRMRRLIDLLAVAGPGGRPASDHAIWLDLAG